MIRQTHSYLVGAISGAMLIAVAVVVFILLLISTQGFRDLPLVNLENDDGAAVAPARAVGAAASQARRAGGGGRGEFAVTGAGSAGGAEGGQATSTSPSSGSPGGGANETASAGSPGGSGGGERRSRPSGGSTGRDTVSRTVAGVVNETVDTVDRGLGGALGRTGVTDTTKRVTDDLAGPGSAIGQTTDRASDAVRGLPKRDD